MAFEGINWGMIPQAAQNEQNLLMQSIGQGIGSYERGQDRELKRRQLEQKASEAQAFNLKEQGQKALYELNLGYPETPERVASAKAYSSLQTPVFGAGGEQAPSPYEQAIMSQSVQQAPQPTQPNYVGVSDDFPAMDNSSNTLAANLGVSDDFIKQYQGSASTVPHVLQAPTISGGVSPSPKTKQEVQEVNLALKKEAASAKIEESKEQRKFMLAKQRNRPKEERGLYNAAQEYGVVDNLIDKAVGQTTDWTTGVTGYMGSFLPSSDASDMRATLKSIKADKMLTRLTELKKEGGTLGALAAKEQEALENSLASLDDWQSKEQLIEGLNRYRLQRQDSVNRVFSAYEDDYGQVPSDISDMFAKHLQKDTAAPSGTLNPAQKSRLEELRAKKAAGTLK